MPSVTRLVGDAAARLIFTPATVGAVTEHERFRTIELTGERLVGTDFVPGDKLRVHLDGLTLRTYTPISWDRDAGSTRILAYVPGDGPGSAWAERVATGDRCSFLGPQRSVRLDRFDAAPVLVGDETSFGLFLAWCNQAPGSSCAASVFEVTRGSTARSALDAHGAGPTLLVERQADQGHQEAFADLVASAVREHPDAPLCLTGCAESIAFVRRRLKEAGLTRRGTVVKAYWDENRKGLD